MQRLFGLIHTIAAAIESAESGPDTGVTEETQLPMHPNLPLVCLPENHVDIWCAALPEKWDLTLAESYQRLLSAEEGERYSRFHFEHDRRQFLLTRALVREVLSRYVGVDPSALVFTRNEYGKPSLVLPADCPITFSLSHTKGLSVCAVALDRPLGVDVESLDRSTSHRDLARRFFAPAEVAFLDNVKGDQQRSEFIRLWTLMEAFVKARGLGLSIPLNSFTINLTHDSPPRLSVADNNTREPAGWQFLQIRLRDAFHVSIAVPLPELQEITVRFSRILPLNDHITSVMLAPNALNEWTLDAV